MSASSGDKWDMQQSRNSYSMYSLFHNTDEKDDNKMKIRLGIRVLTKVLVFFYLLHFFENNLQEGALFLLKDYTSSDMATIS